MPLDGTFDGGPRLPWCTACQQPIKPEEPVTRVYFQTDPEGTQGLTGTYHRQCGQRFQSLARVVNMNPWNGF